MLIENFNENSQNVPSFEALVDTDEKSEVQPNEVIAHERTVLKGYYKMR